ncbi:MAG: hypothetical protein LUD17_00715 [Bacteroidales bacterium]|nr:hypothetical protein [Bacteroidales bacterium]
MKKKSFFLGGAIALALAIAAYSGTNGTQKFQDLELSQVEAISTCESIGWWNNDGNCVTNGSSYFCKNDTWHELTDCKK